MPVEKRWLTPDEVAEYIGVSKLTVYEWVKQERIPFTRLGPAPDPGRKERRKLRFDRHRIDAWIEDNAVEAS